ncbi:hypothetical protein BH09VER1_BH09VER1_55820 [soil metagenome]
MRSWVLTIIVLTGLQITSRCVQAEGRWVCQRFVQTAKPTEADFKIDFVCNHLSQAFFKQTFYFKQDWRYLAEGQWPIGQGWGSSTVGCGPSGSLSVVLSAVARDDGVKIDFSAKRTSSLPSVSVLEAKQRLEIPWQAFPYSYKNGDFSYQVAFSWNKAE